MNAQSLLLSHELAMMATAAKYNLDNKSHRIHSNKSLVQLFFSLTEIIGVDLFVEAGAREDAPADA